MWGDRKNIGWMHFPQNVIARDGDAALFLLSYQNYLNQNKHYVKCMEVLDLQCYKKISKFGLVKRALRENKNTAFVFFIHKN